MRYTTLEHRFVQYIPEQLEAGVLYISMEYATAAHSCCCGCGLQVITPFTPTDWKLTYDGETVSLWPSIGNWNFPCRSHYIIRKNRIVGAGPWEEDRIAEGREQDHKRKSKHYETKPDCKDSKPKPVQSDSSDGPGLWERIKKQVRKKRR
jgi:hypothetical protein